MENLAGSKVWVIEFSDPGMSNRNGVFSTRDKALAYLDAEFKRYKDIWKNRELIDKDGFHDEPSWCVWSFDYGHSFNYGYSIEKYVEIHLYCTEIL